MKNQQNIRTAYHRLYPLLHERYPRHFRPSEHNLTTFTAAVAYVFTRAFDAKIDPWAEEINSPARKSWALIPFIDLANHDTSTPFTYRETKPKGPRSSNGDDDGGTAWEMTAGACYTPGADVFINYGQKSTAEFLHMHVLPVPAGRHCEKVREEVLARESGR